MSTSGNVQQSVVRFTPSEQALCVFSLGLKSKASTDCLLLARRYIEGALKNKSKIKQLVGRRITIPAVSRDSQFVVTVKSFDRSTTK